ncbi:T9SS type A sorting domain-containing protein [Ilyomonas limi]|uniref:T9SS type A sorting domain-containing protein n=1 Tax=Ilyomonas limi TaxID=2575867 RepID=A0A4U3L0S5_9BACT|nr:T9SS type A sorting domain-containing protein [Ilyomonas limi]TKK68548.1 T9SS type A sorting domain-containing protein [Ilyomonas limi]
MQKTLLLFCCMLAMFIVFNARAQCNLQPVIAPDNLILCPNATDSLHTTEEYDTYQWYKDGKMIKDANSRYLKVSQYEDAGYYFTVEITKNECKATAEKVLVDGWAFASPTMMSNIPPRYMDFYGTSYYCAKDSLTFTFMQPYTTNVQWYNNYEPIKGANEQSYHVTGNGSYTVCGSPEVCPDFTACQNLAVVVVFDSLKATVTREGNTFIAGKAQNYQWSLNGRDIPGATGQKYTAEKRGIYRVKVWDKYTCFDVSRPVVYLGLNKGMVTASPNPAASFINVHIEAEEAAQIIISDVYGSRRLQAPVSSLNQRIAVGTLNAGTYLLQVVDKNNNVVATTKFLKQ